jgi:rSAM/selenodomain-associated transferase 1
MDDATDFNGASISEPASCGIAIMAKASAPGRTKTRLVPPLTFDQSASLNTAFLQDIAGNLIAAGRHASIAGYAAFAPAGSQGFFQTVLPPAIGLIDACRPTFGECLLHTIEQIFARGHKSAVVLNSDSPTLPTALLIETAKALARPGERAVLGPATDGGYYLLGLKTAHRRLFADIAWSTERVFEQTLARARELALDVVTLPVWYDVDDVEGLRRLQRDLRRPPAAGRRLTPHTPHYPTATAALLRNLFADDDARHGETIARAAAGGA